MHSFKTEWSLCHTWKDTEHTALDGSVRLFLAQMTVLFPLLASS